MKVELYCPRCSCRFAAPPDTAAEEILERMLDEGPWHGLGDGETFEDMIFNALTSEGEIPCPQCEAPVCVSEESLGKLAMEMLSQW
jgi:hypothetical protein